MPEIADVASVQSHCLTAVRTELIPFWAIGPDGARRMVQAR
jgi:hypothetical protein